ncbi:hypothetical protein CUMW_222300 [Citrus unshiu]|nr:hypothetical protein CUMW_222300 [Citrus unshiu]
MASCCMRAGFVNATKSRGVPTVKAVAYVISKWGPKGILHFKQEGDGPTTIKGTLYYLSQGAHGFHIHVYGDMAHFCQSTGDHFNPFRKDHGGPEDWIRHAGDLGNIYVGFDGKAKINIVDKHKLIPLVGPNSIIGRSVVIHDKHDDLGKGKIELSAHHQLEITTAKRMEMLASLVSKHEWSRMIFRSM